MELSFLSERRAKRLQMCQVMVRRRAWIVGQPGETWKDPVKEKRLRTKEVRKAKDPEISYQYAQLLHIPRHIGTGEAKLSILSI